MANPRLPDIFIPPDPPDYVAPRTGLSRPSANTINETSPTIAQLTRNEIATGKTAPIIYGEDRIAGKWLTYPVIDSGKLLFAILWCDAGENGIEGVQNVYINGQLVEDGVGSVDLTHYDGTQTTADPTLSAALSGFADTYEGLAYSVFSIPDQLITGFPTQKQIEAVIQGRKVLDYRDSTTAYSENPALCLADWVVNEVGAGIYSQGVQDTADNCDEIISGSEVRCQIGLTINKQMRSEEGYDLLSAYAECLWSFSRGLFWMIPDAAVDSPEVVLTRKEMKADTFRITGNDFMRLPTRMVVSFRDPSGDSSQWAEDTVTRDSPAIEESGAPIIPSTVSMPGIHRDTEADRKALMRLRRLSYPAQYAWQCFDNGIKFIRGDVVQLPNMRGLTDRLCRILSIELIALGRYQITAEHYSDDMYAYDFTPGSTANIPVGGIVPLASGASIPSGWERWTDADDTFITGESSGESHGTTGGSTGFTISGTTSDAGAHTGDDNIGGEEWIEGEPSLDTGDPVQNGSNTSESNHNHTYSKGGTRTPLYRRERLIKKITAPGELPQNAMVLADGQLISAALSEVTSYLGRLMQGGDSASGGSSFGFSVAINSGDYSSESDHFHGQRRITGTSSPGFVDTYDHVDAGGHSHNNNVDCTIAPKRRQMCFYLAGSDTEIIPGAVIMFDPNETLPSGWYVCDGTNGTVDLQEYFIERSSSADAGTALGDNTISWSGVTNTVTHDHRGELIGQREGYTGLHPNSIGHSHNVSGTASYRPPFRSVQFVQYTGVV